MTSKLLNISAAGFLVATLVLLFLGLESQQPTAIPLVKAAMICLAISTVIGIVNVILGLRSAARDKQKSDL